MSNTKTSTNVTGVPVVPNAREVLLGLYARTLEDVKVRYSERVRAPPVTTLYQP